MKIGILLQCEAGKPSLQPLCLAQFAGRCFLGLQLDRLVQGAEGIPIAVGYPDTVGGRDIAAFCHRSGITALQLSQDMGLADVGAALGWDVMVRISDMVPFVDAGMLRSLIAVTQTNMFDVVSTHSDGTQQDGTRLDALRIEFLQEFVPSGEDALDWMSQNVDQGTRHVLKRPANLGTAPVNLALRNQQDAARLGALLENAGPQQLRIGTAALVALMQPSEIVSPWQGRAGPLMIAEIGGNHEGDFEVAKVMCQDAINSGADCVKFQLYKGSSLVSPVESPVRYRHFQKFELTREQHIYLAEMTIDAGLSYTSSVWDEEMLEWIDPYLSFYKVGSGDMTAWPLLRKLAARGKPILLSTGLSTMEEVLQTVAMLQRANDIYKRPEHLCVLQCTAMYPIPDSDAHLRVMDTLRETTGLSVGYSDHTVGDAALLSASAMGASALEFHFTDSREGKTFRDHKVSLTAPEVRALSKKIRQACVFRGGAVKTPQESELSEGHEISFRRAIYCARDIAAGETIHAQDLVLLRPAHGTDARDINMVIGATALKNIRAYEAIHTGTHYRQNI